MNKFTWDTATAWAWRNTVLARMRDENYITQAEYEHARDAALVTHYRAPENDFCVGNGAPDMLKRYGEHAYINGFKVYNLSLSRFSWRAATQLTADLCRPDSRCLRREQPKT